MRPGKPNCSDSSLLRQFQHDIPHKRPQVQVLVSVEVGQRLLERSEAVELGAQLAMDVGRVDSPRRHSGQERTPRRCHGAPTVNQGGHFTRRQQRRVLADECQMSTDAEALGIAGLDQRDGRVESGCHGEHRGGRDDAVAMRGDDASTDRWGEAEIVGVHDQLDSRHERARWRAARSSGYSSRASRMILRITGQDDNVDTPRVRGK